MNKENILSTNPDKLTGEACETFDKDPIFKREYEKKWDTEIECSD